MFFILSFGILKITTSKTTRSIYCPKTRARRKNEKGDHTQYRHDFSHSSFHILQKTAMATHRSTQSYKPDPNRQGLLHKRTARRVVVRSRQNSHRAAKECGYRRRRTGRSRPVSRRRFVADMSPGSADALKTTGGGASKSTGGAADQPLGHSVSMRALAIDSAISLVGRFSSSARSNMVARVLGISAIRAVTSSLS